METESAQLLSNLIQLRELIDQRSLIALLIACIGFFGVFYSQNRFDKRQGQSYLDALNLKTIEIDESRKAYRREKLEEYYRLLLDHSLSMKIHSESLYVLIKGKVNSQNPVKDYSLENLFSPANQAVMIAKLNFPELKESSEMLANECHIFLVDLLEERLNHGPETEERMDAIYLLTSKCMMEAEAYSNELSQTPNENKKPTARRQQEGRQ